MRVSLVETSRAVSIPVGLEISNDESPAGLAWRTQRTVVLDDPTQDTRFPTANRVFLDSEIRRVCLMPLTAAERRLGAVAFGRKEEVGYTDSELELLQKATSGVALAVDKGFDTANFVAECRHMQVTPHVAQNDKRRGGSALDERTTRHESYRISQRKRKRIEECFGWLKTIALLRKVRHRGLCKVDWVFTFACAAYNLVRLRKLSVQPT